MSHHLLLKKNVIAVALTLGTSQLVMAQVAATGAPVPRVIITGSNIAKIDSETATPVQVFRRTDIAMLGVNTVRELIDTMTGSTGGLSDIGGSNSFAGGASSGSLRNLGKQSTLILLNSRRIAPYGLADYNEVFTNLDSLPIDAIERVEVLRSGGSAVYGSDAVAGVINIITKSSYEGVTARASHERSTKLSDLRQTTASFTGGIGNLDDDRYNVLVNVEMFKREGSNWREAVDNINPAYGTKFAALRDGSGLMFGNRGTPSTYSYPGNLIGKGPLPGCTTLNAAGQCVYDRFSRFEINPPAERANLLVSGKLKISESIEGFAEATYSKTKTTYNSAFSTYASDAGLTTWGNPATGQARTFDSGYLPSNHYLNGTGEDLELRYRFLDDPASQVSKSDQYRVLAGLKGSTGKYDWETAVGIMGSSSDSRSRGSFSVAGFTQVIGTPGYDADGNLIDPQFFNRGYRLGEKNSPEVLAALFPENGYKGRITQQFLDGKISGEVAQFGGRAVMMAVGGELRHEKFLITPSANLLAGDIVSNGASTADAARTHSSVFTEIEVPVTEKLDFTGAARVDKFPGFSAHVSPKLALRYEAARSIILRGTLETGFRAPNLTESAQSSKFAFSNGVNDPARCSAALAYADDLRTESDALPSTNPLKAIKAAKADSVEGNECAAGVPSTVTNNPNLKPETSRSATVGFVIEPVKGYNLAFDYWNIKRKDEIALKSDADLLKNESLQPAGVINRLTLAQDGTFTSVEGRTTAEVQQQYGVTAGPLASIVGQFLNVSRTKTSGIDVAAAARINSGIGRWDLSFNATRLLDYKVFYNERNGGSYGDNMAGRYGYSKTVANFMASLQTGKINNSLRFLWNSPTSLNDDYTDETYTLEGCAKPQRNWSAQECRVASYVRADYNLSYTGIKNLTLSLNVANVFNRRPPIDYRALNESGGGIIPQSVADVQGRKIRLSMEYKF